MNFLYVINDVDMRLRVVAELSAIMALAKAQRQVFDYKVVCDQTNNTPQLVREGVLSVDIYIKPVYSVNFLVWNFKTNVTDDLKNKFDFIFADYEEQRSWMLDVCGVEI